MVAASIRYVVLKVGDGVADEPLDERVPLDDRVPAGLPDEEATDAPAANRATTGSRSGRLP